VSGEDGDSAEAIRDEILETIANAMDNDELLSEETPEVEKVTLIFDEGPVVAEAGDGSKKKKGIDGIIVAASFAALAALLAAYLVRRRKKTGGGEEDSVAAMFPNSSFVAPDIMNLAKEASAYDVHNCTSQMCTKCYRNNPLQFVPAPMNERGKFVKDNIDAVPSKVSSVELDDSSSVCTEDF